MYLCYSCTKYRIKHLIVVTLDLKNNTSWASQETPKMAECDFPRVFFELEVKILTRNPHTRYVLQVCPKLSLLDFFFSREESLYMQILGFDF